MPNPSGAPTRTVPGQREVGAADLARDRQRLAFHGLGLGQQPLALLGQRITLRPALEQLGLQRVFEGRDAPRHGGVVGLELSCRHSQASCPCDSKKEPQVVPVEGAHGMHHPYWCFGTMLRGFHPWRCDFNNDSVREI